MNIIANIAPVMLSVLMTISNESLKNNKALFLQIVLGNSVVMGLATMFIYYWYVIMLSNI
jgi:hypothetical protein